MTRLRRGQGAATINDVACHAGVSIKTVSRVANGEPNVRVSTRARLQKAIDELGYRANPYARSLALIPRKAEPRDRVESD